MKESKASFVRENVEKEITKQVVWRKFARQRHCIIEKGIDPAYLDTVFPRMLPLFKPQHVVYNGGIANVKDWKISCYLEVMDGGVPTTEPNLPLLDVFSPLLDSLNQIFLHWYRQQHNRERIDSCRRLMTFITRYTSNPGEEALLKHVDGAGKVDGSIVLALPVDRWSAPLEVNRFDGGGLTFWDGKNGAHGPLKTHYDTRSGDIAFIDRAVWHQADPIARGTRWALVIFYKVTTNIE